MHKYIFLDLDGTLLDDDKTIPVSAKEALRLAKEKGHKMIVATGRSNKGVIPAIRDLGFDGYIFSAGAVVEFNNKTIRKKVMDPAIVARLIPIMEDNNLGYILEGYHRSFYNENFTRFLNIQELIEKRSLDEERFRPIEEYTKEDSELFKIAFFTGTMDEAKSFESVMAQETHLHIFTHEKVEGEQINGEITVAGVTKASGIQCMMDHLSQSMDKTVSFGDSLNDLDMIKATNLGISMGNGVKALKEAADDVTDSPAEDGILKAFRKHNLI
jgi:hypothetical protein